MYKRQIRDKIPRKHGTNDDNGKQNEQTTDDDPQVITDCYVFVSDAFATSPRQLMYAHIYNYFIVNKCYDAARALIMEVSLPFGLAIGGDFKRVQAFHGDPLLIMEANWDRLIPSKMLIDSKETFLGEWWEMMKPLDKSVEQYQQEVHLYQAKAQQIPHTIPTPPTRPPHIVEHNSNLQQPSHTNAHNVQYLRMVPQFPYQVMHQLPTPLVRDGNRIGNMKMNPNMMPPNFFAGVKHPTAANAHNTSSHSPNNDNTANWNPAGPTQMPGYNPGHYVPYFNNVYHPPQHNMPYPIPVSYTHLDVYKRQAMTLVA